MATQGNGHDPVCPVCLDTYNTPKALPCQHTFCLRCLEPLVVSRNKIKCPECRREHHVPASGIKGFPSNIAVQRILDVSALPNIQMPPSSSSNSPSTNMTPTDHNRKTNLDRNNCSSSNAPQQRPDDIALQMAVHISLVEQQENSNVNNSTNQSRRNANQTDACGCFIIRSMRNYLRRITSTILNKYKIMLTLFIVAYIFVTISRFIAGAVKLTSDCDIERRVAVYLFVKACFAMVFWGVLAFWHWKNILGKVFDNRFVEAYLVLESFFSVCWLFAGTYWICHNFNSIRSHCAAIDANWNGHFINFALFLTVVDYIGLVVFLFYFGYTVCESENEEGN